MKRWSIEVAMTFWRTAEVEAIDEEAARRKLREAIAEVTDEYPREGVIGDVSLGTPEFGGYNDEQWWDIEELEEWEEEDV